MYYRARKNGSLNIFKKDPGRVKQNSQGTAGRNFTKRNHIPGDGNKREPEMD